MRYPTIGVTACLVLVSACTTPGPVSLGDLRPGESVRAIFRVPSPDSVLTRPLIRQVNGSIEVTTEADSNPFRIHLADLDRLQIIRGRARPKATLTGAIAGGLGGIVIGMVCQSQCARNDKGARYLAPVVGFAVGLPLGAAVGAILAPVRWIDVRLR